MAKTQRLLILMLGIGLLALSGPGCQESEELLFYLDTCPVCKEAYPFVEELESEHPDLVISRHEVSRNSAGREVFRAKVDELGIDRVAVPTFVLGERYWVGYSERVRTQIREALGAGETAADASTLSLPVLGAVDVGALSAFSSTGLIALVDGFNPCSLWLLTFLLGVIVHTRSRARTLAVGLTFLTVTAALYGMFILGVFGLFVLGEGMDLLRYAVVVLALIFGAINVKDYFALRRGVSLSIDGKQKRAIGERIRGLMAVSSSPLLLVGSTALLAAGVTFIELPCTAGLPVLWARVIDQADVTGGLFWALFTFYLVVYLADELIILTLAIVTLKRAAFEEKHGRFLKLLGGTLMAALGVSLLVAPEGGGSFQGVLLAFLIAAAVTVGVHLLYTRLLAAPSGE